MSRTWNMIIEQNLHLLLKSYSPWYFVQPTISRNEMWEHANYILYCCSRKRLTELYKQTFWIRIVIKDILSELCVPSGFSFGTKAFIQHAIVWVVPLGILSKENGDGDGDRRFSEKIQIIICALMAWKSLTFCVRPRHETSHFDVGWKREYFFRLLCYLNVKHSREAI